MTAGERHRVEHFPGRRACTKARRQEENSLGHPRGARVGAAGEAQGAGEEWDLGEAGGWGALHREWEGEDQNGSGRKEGAASICSKIMADFEVTLISGPFPKGKGSRWNAFPPKDMCQSDFLYFFFF